MNGYTKLFSSILASTIWNADHTTRIVWITLLAMADMRGIAEGSVPGLAGFAHVTIDECKKALVELQAPDEYSRTQEHDGRRIAVVDGGWQILNHSKYRSKLGADERREYLRVKQAEYRKKKAVEKAVNTASTPVADVSDTSTQSTHAEADTDTYKDQDLVLLSSGDDANKPKAAVAKSKAVVNPAALQALWNEIVTAPIPACRELGKPRVSKVIARMRERPLSEWRDIIARIEASDYCRNAAPGSTGWVATFDWLLRPDTAIKVLEGKYDNRESSNGRRDTLGVANAKAAAEYLQRSNGPQRPEQDRPMGFLDGK